VAATAFLTGALAASFAPRTVVWVGALVLALAGMAVSTIVRDTAGHVAHEQQERGRRAALPLRRAFAETTVRNPVLRSCSQAGMVNNLNDALAWGLVPLYLGAHGASVSEIGAVAAVYPLVWGCLQLPAGWLSDHVGRKAPIVAGMVAQGAALAVLVAGRGDFGVALAAAGLLGVGTALVYPTLIAAVSDAVEPSERATVVGVYRFWRDAGFVVGALLVGFASDSFGSGETIVLVAALTALSGLLVAATNFTSADSRYRQLPLGRWASRA
jgi:MFS family permease